MVFFFFSSRRRHTRWNCDWSSDVCSSDLGIDAHHLVGAGGHALVAHLARHAHALEHAGGVGGADGAGLPDVHGTVRFRPAAELVALDEALEALAFASAGHVDELAGGEDLHLELLALLEAVVAADLDEVPVRVEAGLLEGAELGLRYAALGDRLECDPRGRVAVPLLRAQAEDAARARLPHGHGGGRAVGVEQLGHAQLSGEESFHD